MSCLRVRKEVLQEGRLAAAENSFGKKYEKRCAAGLRSQKFFLLRFDAAPYLIVKQSVVVLVRK
jgi:hypothetical protein